MSTTHNEAPHDAATTATNPTDTHDFAPASPGQRRTGSPVDGSEGSGRRRIAIAAVVAIAVAGAAGGLVIWKSGQPKHAVTSAMALPAKVGNLSPMAAASDPLKAERFQTRAKGAVGTAPYGAQTYGTANTQRTIRVVAARTDLTKKLDETMAVDAGTETDGVSCTQNVQLVAGGKSAVRPTVMFCWQNSPTLSVYTLIIDPRTTQVSLADGVASVKQVWDAVN